MSYFCFIFPRFQNESLDHKYYLCRTVSGLVLCVCNGYEWGSRCCFIWKSRGGGWTLGWTAEPIRLTTGYATNGAVDQFNPFRFSLSWDKNLLFVLLSCRLFSDRKFSGLPGYLRAVERSPCGFNQRERLQALQRDLSEMLEDPLWLFVLTDIISLVTTEHRQHNDQCYASANHLSQLAHVSVTFPVRI